MQRGHNQKATFVEKADYERYLQNLRELRTRFGVHVNGYCLMTNHVHLLLSPVENETAISQLMKHLSARQTRFLNRVEHRTGTLWSGRFHCSVVDTERYLLACSRYIDMNPVRALMVDDPADYPWSSYRQKAGLVGEFWIDEDPAYEALGTTAAERRTRYREFLASEIPDEQLALIRTAVKRNQLTGSREFADDIALRAGRRMYLRGRGRPSKK
ncbi:transposase [soil metagenome]